MSLFAIIIMHALHRHGSLVSYFTRQVHGGIAIRMVSSFHLVRHTNSTDWSRPMGGITIGGLIITQ